MRPGVRGLVTAAAFAAAAAVLTARSALPPGYWPPARVAEVLAHTGEVRLAPDLSSLTRGERAALDELIAAGRIFQDLYEQARHPDALAARQAIEALARREPGEETRNLLTLYRLNAGPVASSLDDGRSPFAPVRHESPGRNLYPPDIERAEVDAWLQAHPEDRPALLDARTVVRRATAGNLKADMTALADPLLRTLHPAVAARVDALARRPDGKTLYAVPQAVAWAAPLRAAYGHLLKAAGAVEPDDADFAGYLRNRARDLLSNDYESGDASWVTGHFRHLNAVIGSYESYQDSLYGAKAFPEVSLLLVDEAATRDVRARIKGLQAVEDALPSEIHKRVRDDIPVAFYDVIADFGHARGLNTATILPNDSRLARRYGRTILLRRNIMEHADLFAVTLRRWQAVMAPAVANDLSQAGQSQRTLWHEVGHYLGVDRDRQDRPLDDALGEHADAIEELKADLVSLFTLHAQARAGTITPELLRAVQAGGIMRTLQTSKPRPDQPYGRMQLAQFNYFLDKGLLTVEGDGHLAVHAERYEATVASLLREVLALQYQGDAAAAGAFLTKWNGWTPELHQRLAGMLRGPQGPRFRLVRYAALGE